MSGDVHALDVAIESHIRSHFAERRVHVTKPVRYSERLPSPVRVFEVEPSEPNGLWTYVSCGAWQVEPTAGPRMEFLMLAPEQSVRPAQLLRMTAWYHADPNPSFQLGWGHTLPIGEPWLEGSRCDVLLVSKPYTLDADFGVLDALGTHVHFFWLLPITEAERQFRKEHGLDALEEEFERAQLAYWNPLRPSVV